VVGVGILCLGDLLIGAVAKEQRDAIGRFRGAGYYPDQLGGLSHCVPHCDPVANINGWSAWYQAQVMHSDLEMATS
jgi:hypothetical protein